MPVSIAKLNEFGMLARIDSKTNRRRWLASAIAGVTGFLCLPVASNAADTDSESSTSKPSMTTRVKSVLEVKGSVKLKNHQSKKENDHRSAAIEAKSTLEYEEEYRLSSASNESKADAALQVYAIAELDNLIEKHATKLSLREPCRDIIKRHDSEIMMTACVGHPLTAAERDLVEGPLSTMYLESLLPTQAIKLGDSWEVEADAVAKLLNLDSVTSGTIRVTLVDADTEFGQIELRGTLQGQVRNIGTRIELEGKAKIERKKGIVAWLALSLEEDRDVSESEPGFSVQARLRVLRERIEGLSSGATLQELEGQLDVASSAQLTQFDSHLGAYRFVADRNWTTYSDSGVDATLRWVKANRVVAQCTVTNLTDMEPGRQLSIEGYQNDIQKSLDKRFGQFLEADERISQSGLRHDSRRHDGPSRNGAGAVDPYPAFERLRATSGTRLLAERLLGRFVRIARSPNGRVA